MNLTFTNQSIGLVSIIGNNIGGDTYYVKVNFTVPDIANPNNGAVRQGQPISLDIVVRIADIASLAIRGKTQQDIANEAGEAQARVIIYQEYLQVINS